MAEETKEKKAKVSVKTIGKMLIGIILIVLGLGTLIIWRGELLALIKGCIGLILIMAGAIAIAIAKE